MISINKNRKGFTIIELVVIISIIALLSAAVLTALNPIRKRGRDARRIADLSSIQVSLNLYYSKANAYPVADSWDTLKTRLAEVGVNKIPSDPLGGAYAYSYTLCVGSQSYVLHANLETDPGAAGDTLYKDSTVGTICGVACDHSAGVTNYCVSE